MIEFSALTDNELQLHLVRGNEQAFTVLYERYATDIKSIALKVLKSEALAEDATQEVFIKIWNGRAQLQQVKVFKAYLIITARNHALNILKSAVRSEAVMADIVTTFTDQRNTTDEDLLSKEYLQFIQLVLDRLPARSREIFTKCRMQEKSYDEVADELGISRNAVKNHMVLSIRVLRKAVESELGIPLSVLLAVYFGA
ncbi:RNA polymerase sigma factor [Mucilaginibacter celer]|uniref:RNA polymerase sigma-70 factor n=1 Tax=Mucilaginibacter celer TaxID=2305508 RepID=A0A494VJ89_9SPHI|nr:RNA polymerase sigma-70 factor [Mucilaginibacter celer]AYL93839.1 RNA polymerase sigma-70 factor [Mucilaginibacter celer]